MNRKQQAMGGPGQPTEAALFSQAQAGCRDSLNRLMATHEHLVHAVVRQQVLGHLPFPEALQAGRIGLWRAILGYDPQRGLAFSTYAWRAIMHQVWREVKVTERQHERDSVHLLLAAVPFSTGGRLDPAEVWEVSAVHTAVRALVVRLPDTLRIVIVARYGFNGKGRAAWSQIGALLGFSRERARQWHTEALIWLRQPAYSQQLRSLLGYHTVADYEAAEAETQHWLRWRGGRSERSS